MSDHVRRPQGRVLFAQCMPGLRTLLVSTVLLLSTACVRWQPVSSVAIAARPLPRWVKVTMRDSAQYRLEHAQVVPGDTLVGDSAATASAVRLPVAEIAHLEARVPSGPGSIGMGAVVIGSVAAMLVLLGHVSSPTP